MNNVPYNGQHTQADAGALVPRVEQAFSIDHFRRREEELNKVENQLRVLKEQNRRDAIQHIEELRRKALDGQRAA